MIKLKNIDILASYIDLFLESVTMILTDTIIYDRLLLINRLKIGIKDVIIMSFLSSDDDIGIKYKQLRINLSKKAMYVIKNDITNFNADLRENYFNRSNFICRVFINSAASLDSFVSNRMEQTNLDYDNFFTEKDEISGQFTPEQIEMINFYIIDKMLDITRTECEEQIKQFVAYKNESMIIYLNEDVVSFLCSKDFFHEETAFKGKLSSFFKAVLEEYSLLPYYEREKIVFKKTLDSLLPMCWTNLSEKIYHPVVQICNNRSKKDIIYHVIPFHCGLDISNTYNYLLCYARQRDSEEWHVMKFRLSHIKLLPDTKDTLRIKIPKEASDLLNDWIKNGFRMFNNEIVHIKVKFTETGERLYGIIRHHRPPITRKNGSIYEFDCSEYEAINYFTSFTGEAVVLEPLSLRQKLYDRFKNGVKQYALPEFEEDKD